MHTTTVELAQHAEPITRLGEGFKEEIIGVKCQQCGKASTINQVLLSNIYTGKECSHCGTMLFENVTEYDHATG